MRSRCSHPDTQIDPMTTILPGKWPALEFLNPAEPIFVIPLAYFVLKERIKIRSVIGAISVVAGVALILLNSPVK